MKKILLGLFASSIILAAHQEVMSQKIQKPSFNHMALYVFDLKKSAWFYHDVLNFDVIPEPFHDGKHIWLKVSQHGQLHLISGAASVPERDKNTHLCFTVPNLKDMMKRLDTYKVDYGNWAGDSKVPTRRADGVEQIYLKDPDGYWIEINNDRY